MKNIVDIMNERNPKRQIKRAPQEIERSRKDYQHEYYMRVTKPKRQAQKMERTNDKSRKDKRTD